MDCAVLTYPFCVINWVANIFLDLDLDLLKTSIGLFVDLPQTVSMTFFENAARRASKYG